MNRRQLGVLGTMLVLGAGGLGTGLGLGFAGGAATVGLKPASSQASYAYYMTVAKRYARQPGGGYGGMMGGSYSPMARGGGYSWMVGRSGYAWMMGGASAPGWMVGGSLPASMMGSGDGMGEVMGRLFANAPGPRVSPSDAKRLGEAAPSGANIDKAANTVTFGGQSVNFAVLASPSMPAENFEVAGLTDPTIVVGQGARVTVELVNADSDMAHGFVVSDTSVGSSWMPMMTAGPAFSGSALWFLGEPTSAGMHAGTLSFTASTAGTYSYFCPVPGHAEEGMEGSFVVQPARAA